MVLSRFAIVGFTVFCLFSSAAVQSEPVAAEPMRVSYPHYVGDDPVFTRFTDYFEDLLELALLKSRQSFTLLPVPGKAVTDRRAMRNLDSGIYDVNFMHTNPDRETTLHPVYFPMFKGLAGWRLLLVREGEGKKFGRDLMPGEFKAKRAGLGHDWPDLEYMQAGGYTVVTSVGRESLVSMLLGGRVDYVSRSVIEVWGELEHYQPMPLEVACCVAIHYPSAFYMFTSRANKELAEILTEGLNVALRDGSFDQLFMRYYGVYIERSNLSGRRVFELDNPSLSENTPTERSELWFKP